MNFFIGLHINENVYLSASILTLCTDKHGSTCIDISYQQLRDTKSGSYTWQLGPCPVFHPYSGNGRYTEKCCVPNGDHIFSCTNSQGNGWDNAVVKIGDHQFCDDFVGYNKLIKINIPGSTEDTFLHNTFHVKFHFYG